MAPLLSLVCCVCTVLLAVPPSGAHSPPGPYPGLADPPGLPPSCHHEYQQLKKGQKSIQQQLATLQLVLKVCPAGWSAHGDNCFLVVSEQKTAAGAAAACALLDPRARLASLHPDHREHVHGLIDSSPSERVWIGLQRVPAVGYGADGWKWSDGSRLEGEGPWLPNQPDNNGGESCVQYDRTGRYHGWTRGWSDERCVLTAAYVCQISLAHC